MKYLLLLYFLSLPFTVAQSNNDNPEVETDLFTVTVNGKKGFIDRSGKIIIPPTYQDAIGFSEGMCAVRIGGRYGFIDRKGVVNIPATYDYATVFNEGLALVFLDGKPLFINKEGKTVIQSTYKRMSSFKDGFSYVHTLTDKWGVINTSGELVVDTAFKDIGPFQDGMAIVEGIDHQEYDTDEKKKNLQVSVVDESGKLLFPYGKFERIESYSEGFFQAALPQRRKRNGSVEVIIDRKGNEIFRAPKKRMSWIDGGVHNGVVRVSLPVKKKSDDHYDAYMTLSGTIIYNNRDVYSGRDFQGNVAFVGDRDFDFWVIDRKGNVLSESKFDALSETGFQNGVALVKNAKGWAVIDTTCAVLLQTKYDDVYSAGLVEDKYLFFQSKESDNYEDMRYGMMDLNGREIIPAILQDFNPEGFAGGLLQTYVDNRVAYFNREGEKVWHDPLPEQPTIVPLNIDYMNRGYFYANYDYTGHTEESEYAEPEAVSDLNNFTPASLTVVASAQDSMPFFKTVKGMRVEVANTTADTMIFNAQDNRLYMKMQAQDRNGTWRDIEYLPSSWCGNSYHSVKLPPNRFWTFVAPVYEGEFNTTLRIALTYVDPTDKPTDEELKSYRAYRNKRQVSIYSNEFQGSINPGQFWRKQDYHPTNIMDPYLE